MTSTIEQLKGEIDPGNIDPPFLMNLYRNCFYSTLETTTEMLPDGTSFVFTGDIPAMWLRDSSAQVRHYIPFSVKNVLLRQIIKGLIKRQMQYIRTDPYANAFNREPDNAGHKQDRTQQNPWVWERKYEVDSLCYPIQLSYLYWKATGETSVFDNGFREAVRTILELWQREQHHLDDSPYCFERAGGSPTDTLQNGGRGTPVRYTGMTWSGFRPSDDACTFHYLIPANMFAVVALRYIEEIARDVWKDGTLAGSAKKLGGEINDGIQNYGIFPHPKYGPIYAYETDGMGHYNLMDDANVPSLLSIPYLQYQAAEDPVCAHTRRFLLSRDNPWFFEGSCAKGIGSPHTSEDYIWHIGLIMQALTSTDEEEIRELLKMIAGTDADTGYMHESFHEDDPGQFTRPWFAWANSLFAELIYRIMKDGKQYLFHW